MDITIVSEKVKELKRLEKEAEEQKKAELKLAKETERKRREDVLKKDREKQKALESLWNPISTKADSSDDFHDWITDFEPEPKKSRKWGNIIRQFADGTYEIQTPDGKLVNARSLEEARKMYEYRLK